MSITVDQARELMHEWVESPSLRAHMEAVATCMGGYASEIAPEERDDWIIAGLLHDMDYERHPTEEEHPYVGVEHLRARGDVRSEITRAILAHADYSGVPREDDLSRYLYAVDELAGFIVACAKVRPDGIASLEARSVRKKLKNLKFAAAVSREDVARGAEDIGLDPAVHIENCIAFMRADDQRLGI